MCNRDVEIKGLGTWYSPAYMTLAHGQCRFTVSVVVADCYELIVPQCIVQPSIAFAVQHADITPLQSAMICLYPHQISYFPSREG